MIPTQTLVEYPVFGNAACLVKPGDAKYAGGFLPADVLPAEWHNWFLNTASSAITCLNAGVGSMEAELNCVVTSAGLQPAEGTPGQVAQAISCCVTNAVTRTIQITDSTGANCGNAVSFTSATALQIALPATICATLQGNAATATLATCAQKDGSGCSFGTAARFACGCFAAAYNGDTKTVECANVGLMIRISEGTTNAYRGILYNNTSISNNSEIPVCSSNFQFNPSLGILCVPYVCGTLYGNAATATTATCAQALTCIIDSTQCDGTFNIAFLNSGGSTPNVLNNLNARISSKLTYTPTTNTLGANISGASAASSSLKDAGHSWSATELYNYMMARMTCSGGTFTGPVAFKDSRYMQQLSIVRVSNGGDSVISYWGGADGSSQYGALGFDCSYNFIGRVGNCSSNAWYITKNGCFSGCANCADTAYQATQLKGYIIGTIGQTGVYKASSNSLTCIYSPSGNHMYKNIQTGAIYGAKAGWTCVGPGTQLNCTWVYYNLGY